MFYEAAAPTRDEDYPLIDVTARDGYNRAILEEAIACQVDNVINDEEEDEGADEELGAQILICKERTGPELDRAIDHLRQMLLVSYLDLTDLPRPIPAREEPATGELRVSLTEGQREALRQAATAIIDTSPEDDEVAAFEAILAALDAMDGVL